ncbi:MAG: molecular chaperone DnaJ [Deltaproteobacteria bacterium]|nr:molecular chaperone DnaJ [Deltaproteobacteria bacterium]MBW1952316.1 molecular chaperone DnaJ [Deltaproteobacteria bacterium]MBW1986507.1 molecular chaperone DnaJ [Deltaproteobacteria bacterium]MBW2135086.1 molecular chaperone DnaJ [Deltaproteobacteria bacterium]
MNGKADYYEVLGVNRDADADEIKRAYRRQALKYHPDRNPGDQQAEEKFKEAAEAYEVLIDPGKRRLYDQYGHAGLRDVQFGGFSDFADIFSSFDDIFEDFFGFGRRQARRQPRQGADLLYNLEISFLDAVFGLETDIEISKSVICETCRGSGVKPGSQRRTCSFCGGRGQVSQTRGFFRVNTTCPHCRGTGSMITDPCTQCQGRGRVKQKKKVNLKIPPGVDNGTRLRLRNEGSTGEYGGPPGDLYIDLRVTPHPRFSREGSDLICRVEVSFVQAALGTEIEVPTLTGQSRLTIPPGTQPGASFRLPGEGVPTLRGNSRGDLVVELDLKTPQELTPKQEELLREFLKLEKSEQSSPSGSRQKRPRQSPSIFS